MQKVKTAKRESYIPRLKTTIDTFLKIEDTYRNLLEIIYWWEKRRVAFNLIIIFFGYINISFSRFFLKIAPEENLYCGFSLFSMILLANIAYSLSCISELFKKTDNLYAPHLYKKGVIFIIILSLLPMLAHAKEWFLSIL
ncbi:hypothetical protein ACFLRU_07395 [Bacteroidota bacterium]